MSSLEAKSIAVTLVVSITIYWHTDCIILTSVGVAWIKFRFAISSGILGIACTYVVVDEVCAVPINTWVGVALINVTITISALITWRTFTIVVTQIVMTGT